MFQDENIIYGDMPEVKARDRTGDTQEPVS
jgi:hypothetical protein